MQESDYKHYGNTKIYKDMICVGGPLANHETHLYFNSQFPSFKCHVTQDIYNRNISAKDCIPLYYCKNMMIVNDFIGFKYGAEETESFKCDYNFEDYAIITKLTDRDLMKDNSSSLTVHIMFGFTAESTLAAINYFCTYYKNLYERFGDDHYFIALKVIPSAGHVDLSTNNGIIDLTDKMFKN